MKPLLIACALIVATAASSAAQKGLGQVTSDRNRKEALQHYRLGQDAMHHERFDIAEKEFEKSAAIDATLELAPYGLGQVYMATKRFRAAVVAFTKSREVFLGNNVSNADDEVMRQRQLDDNIRELEDQQSIYARNANNATARVYLQTLTTQIAGMKAAKMRGMSSPEPVPAWLSLALGSAFFRSDALADAEREYRAAIEVDPKLGEAHNNLAVVYLMTGRATMAETEIAAAEKAGFKVNPQLKEDVKKAR